MPLIPTNRNVAELLSCSYQPTQEKNVVTSVNRFHSCSYRESFFHGTCRSHFWHCTHTNHIPDFATLSAHSKVFGETRVIRNYTTRNSRELGLTCMVPTRTMNSRDMLAFVCVPVKRKWKRQPFLPTTWAAPWRQQGAIQLECNAVVV